jgi:hypothetical protein
MGHFSKTCYLCCTSAKYQQRTVKSFTRKIQNKRNGGKCLNAQLSEKYILVKDVSWGV